MREAAEGRGVALDYADVVDSATLEPLESLDRPARAIVAGRVGGTRLIDNCELVAVRSELSATARSEVR